MEILERRAASARVEATRWAAAVPVPPLARIRRRARIASATPVLILAVAVVGAGFALTRPDRSAAPASGTAGIWERTGFGAAEIWTPQDWRVIGERDTRPCIRRDRHALYRNASAIRCREESAVLATTIELDQTTEIPTGEPRRFGAVAGVVLRSSDTFLQVVFPELKLRVTATFPPHEAELVSAVFESIRPLNYEDPPRLPDDAEPWPGRSTDRGRGEDP